MSQAFTNMPVFLKLDFLFLGHYHPFSDRFSPGVLQRLHDPASVPYVFPGSYRSLCPVPRHQKKDDLGTVSFSDHGLRNPFTDILYAGNTGMAHFP